jgi:hypothetical protein
MGEIERTYTLTTISSGGLRKIFSFEAHYKLNNTDDYR